MAAGGSRKAGQARSDLMILVLWCFMWQVCDRALRDSLRASALVGLLVAAFAAAALEVLGRQSSDSSYSASV